MLKLYYLQGGCPLVVHTALEWAKAEFEAVSVPHAELKSAEFLTLNPAGAVPVLQDGDWTLTQNTAILSYLDECYPEARIFGSGDARARAKARQWLGFANADLHPAFGFVFNPNKFIEGEGEGAQIRARATLKVTELYGLINAELADKEYLTGELTAADVYVYVTLRWAKMFRFDLAALENLEAYYQRVEADEGVQKALKAQGLL